MADSLQLDGTKLNLNNKKFAAAQVNVIDADNQNDALRLKKYQCDKSAKLTTSDTIINNTLSQTSILPLSSSVSLSSTLTLPLMTTTKSNCDVTTAISYQVKKKYKILFRSNESMLISVGHLLASVK